MNFRHFQWLAGAAALAACASQLEGQQQQLNMETSFFNMTNSSFSVRATAPKDRIRELAVCKAVWFAEFKKVESFSLSNPTYSQPENKSFLRFPTDWIALTTTAYITAPNPDGNPPINVAEMARVCRSGWDWYR